MHSMTAIAVLAAVLGLVAMMCDCAQPASASSSQPASAPSSTQPTTAGATILVTSSWDDGSRNDVRLIEILQKYKARGTFFIYPVNYVLLEKEGNDVALKVDAWLIAPHSRFVETYSHYDGVEIGAHGYHHPDMRKLPPDELKFELTESKRVLEAWFKRPVVGMAYPFGAYDANVLAAVKAAGYQYARAVKDNQSVYPPPSPLELAPSLHFQNPKFWQEFERVKATGGVFYFWGHSHEIKTEEQWQQFEAIIAKLSADPAVKWVTNAELMAAKR